MLVWDLSDFGPDFGPDFAPDFAPDFLLDFGCFALGVDIVRLLVAVLLAARIDCLAPPRRITISMPHGAV
ncbi:MAG: hypothetical protein ACJAU6_000252 [Alphaproteobacteria bacterium]